MRYYLPFLLIGSLFACQEASPPTAPTSDPEVSPQRASSQPTSGNIVIVNLGFSAALDVDGQGRAVGWSSSSTGARAVLWTPATPRGTTGSFTILSSSASDTYAWGLNEAGEIAGGSKDGTPTLHAKVWNGGTAYSIGEPAGMVESFAEDISDPQPSGERLVIGRSDATASSRPTIWRVSGTGAGFAVVAVNLLPGFRADGAGEAIGVNSSGLVVGDALNDTGDPQPAKWTPAGTSWSLTALGLLPGQTYGQVLGVSASGAAVGFNRPGGTTECPHGAVWPANALTPKPLQDLAGGFCSIGWDINAAGQITGSARDSRGQDQAVLWLPNAGGTYNVLMLGNLNGARRSEGRGLNEPHAGASGAMELEVVGTSGPAALWKVKLP